METSSTRRAAQILGISGSTLDRYLRIGKVPAPKSVEISGRRMYLWTAEDIERVRKLLPTIEDGRTTRHRKARESKNEAL